MGFLHTYFTCVVKFPTKMEGRISAMADATRILDGTALPPLALPPLTLPPHRSRSGRPEGHLPRLGRSACVLAALALLALGIAVADTVHRAGEPGTMQAAAPVDRIDRAAAPRDVSRRVRP